MTCRGLPGRQWQVHWCQPRLLVLSSPPNLALLTSGIAFGTSVRFWCRQATCRLELSQTQVCGQRWAAACQVGPSGSSRGSSSTKETLWGLRERARVSCSQGQGSQAVHSLGTSSCSQSPSDVFLLWPQGRCYYPEPPPLHEAEVPSLALFDTRGNRLRQATSRVP